jgi:hypothetical protein
LMRVRLLLDRCAEVNHLPARDPATTPPAPALTPRTPAPMPAPRMLEAEPCAQCGGRNVHRSRARGPWERFRRLHSLRRPYRCEDCGWRGWLLPLEHVMPLLERARPGCGRADVA